MKNRAFPNPSLSTSRRRFLQASAGAAAAGALLGASGLALAQSTRPEVVWKAVSQHRLGASFKKWQWLEEVLPERTGNHLGIELSTIPELGLQGTEMLRVLRTGLINIAEVLTGYVASDFPMIEATDLPGLVGSYAQSRQLYDAWTENVVAKNEEVMAGKVLATFCWGTMYLFTSFPMESLEDLRGKKIRVFAPAQARYITALGGEPISMTTAEVYSALQRGVIDGTITGPDQVQGMSLFEVARHVTNINISPLGSYIVVSRRSWDALPGEAQQVLNDLADDLTNLGWDLGEENNQVGLDLARERGMSVREESPPEWQETLSRISAEDIVPWWADRVGPEGRQAFNDYLAPIAGFQI